MMLPEEMAMSCRVVRMLQVVGVIVALIAAGRAFGAGGEEGKTGILDTRRLLSEEREERSRALEGLAAEYREVSAALLKTLEEAKAQFRNDRGQDSPLHCAILAVAAWQVIGADDLLLSMVDYELDVASVYGMDVSGGYFFPAASALVHLRVDVAKVTRAIAAAKDPKTLRLLAWVLLKREGDVEKAQRSLADARSKSRGADTKRQFSKAIELLDDPSELLPPPTRGGAAGAAPPRPPAAQTQRELPEGVLKAIEEARARGAQAALEARRKAQEAEAAKEHAAEGAGAGKAAEAAPEPPPAQEQGK